MAKDSNLKEIKYLKSEPNGVWSAYMAYEAYRGLD